MTKNTRILLLATSLTSLFRLDASAGVRQPMPPARQSAPAPAKDEGFYVRADAGASLLSGADVRLALPYGQGLQGAAKFKAGFVYGGAVGYRVGEIAVEGELDSTHNKFKSGPGDFSWNQSLRQLTLLGNVIWNYKMEGVSLELGGGLGGQFQNNNFSNFSSTESGVVVAGDSLTTAFSKKSDTAFVGQLKAGISIPLDPNWSFNAGYKVRFISETDLGSGTLSYQASPSAAVEHAASKLRLSSHYGHLLTAGFTYLF